MLDNTLMPDLHHHIHGTSIFQRGSIPSRFNTQVPADLKALLPGKWIGRAGHTALAFSVPDNFRFVKDITKFL